MNEGAMPLANQQTGRSHPTAETADAGGPAPPSAVVPARVRWASIGYLALAWIFVVCVAVQVFFAGLATFVDAQRWSWHTSFVHLFELVPLVMLGPAFVARLPSRTRWLTAAAFFLLGLQYALVESGNPTLAALHPVNALVIFWVAVTLARR